MVESGFPKLLTVCSFYQMRVAFAILQSPRVETIFCCSAEVRAGFATSDAIHGGFSNLWRLLCSYQRVGSTLSGVQYSLQDSLEGCAKNETR